jgi:hypothetical protein
MGTLLRGAGRPRIGMEDAFVERLCLCVCVRVIRKLACVEGINEIDSGLF